MLSRLVILSLAREVAEYMERSRVSSPRVDNWNRKVIDAAMQSALTVESTRVLEDRLALLFREGLDMADEARNATQE